MDWYDKYVDDVSNVEKDGLKYTEHQEYVLVYRKDSLEHVIEFCLLDTGSMEPYIFNGFINCSSGCQIRWHYGYNTVPKLGVLTGILTELQGLEGKI